MWGGFEMTPPGYSRVYNKIRIINAISKRNRQRIKKFGGLVQKSPVLK